MHMPLFNLQNCKDEMEINKEREKYKTFQQHYGASEIQHLLEKAQANLKKNRDKILQQIIMSVQRRKSRNISEGQPVHRSMIYYLMPIGSNPFPMGPISMPYWPQLTPGQNGSPWGYYYAQQQNGSPWGYHQAQQPSQVPAQGQNTPPPPPPMAFPGYFLLPMACAPSYLPQHSAPYGLPQTPT